MDGKGRWVDNVFVEHLWRSVKYEEVYLKAYDSMAAAKASLGRYFAFYLNSAIPHFRSKLRVISIYLSKYTRCSSIFSAVNRDEKC